MAKQFPVIFTALLIVDTCIACYVEFITKDSGDNNWMKQPETISDYYIPLIDQGVDPSSQSVWYFELKSCGNTGILVTTNSNLAGVIFEIKIASYGNTRITFRNSTLIADHIFTGAVVHCTIFTRFWLSWTLDGTVSLGAGDTAGVNTYLTTGTPGTAIGGIGVNSGYGSNGEWRYGTISSMNVPDNCSTNQPQTSLSTSFDMSTSTATSDTSPSTATSDTSPSTGTSDTSPSTTTSVTSPSTTMYDTSPSTTTSDTSPSTTISDMSTSTSNIALSSAILSGSLSSATNLDMSTTLSSDGNTEHTPLNNSSKNHSTTATPCMCSCAANPVNKTKEMIKQEDVVYKVDKTKLSAYRRKQTSAADPRKSSMYIGMFGISVISICVLFIVGLDCLKNTPSNQMFQSKI